jgi:hypothetical protein
MEPAPTSLKMTTRRRFGAGSLARLNRELFAALKESAPGCETCRDIAKDLEPDSDGADFVEAPSFPGATVDRMDAHFRYHWKDAYERVDTNGRA